MNFRHLVLLPHMALAGLALSLAGCAAIDAPATGVPASEGPAESIAYEVGPCFGFCPVYNARIASNGTVAFEGIRHTMTIGKQAVTKDAATYRAFAEALAPFRPADGTTASTTCDARISDQQHYRITWTSADGKTTVLEHDRGCRSPRNDRLNAVLEAAPERLGIADLARQTTRPGASRG
ncbi:DUF6438 domain-containing protein [Sphingobium lignivorans]|uniref:DUF6438 domain-containing protein n=1 Tax=Sphingobium lignivorans TaxID=2735886 RepID=A0ABR6NEP9_9SPHN|nr:DUF6438 domain-containing protein [Sphingobium lignivorans]MBB5985745.1 hypothetical protein [Sphingobium lignivorans]